MAKKITTKKTPAKKKLGQEIDDSVRIIEAAIFAATDPLSKKDIMALLPKKSSAKIDGILDSLVKSYQSRGINLLENKNGFYFRTAPDLARHLTHFRTVTKKLSRAAMETLAIIAYHQPVTRAEIEIIRGVAMSKGTLDILLETGWIKFKGRRKTIGNPITLGTSEQFLLDFGLKDLKSLPGLEELKEMGLLQMGRDFGSIGMGEEEEDAIDDDQPDLLSSALDDILNDPKEQQGDKNQEGEANELLMDEPLDDMPTDKKSKTAPMPMTSASLDMSLSEILDSSKKQPQKKL